MRGPKERGQPYGVGYYHTDGTWEIFPDYYHNMWLCLYHWLYCWVRGWPHLITVMKNPKAGMEGEPSHIQWFRRHWITPKLSLWKWGLSIYWHHYPNEMHGDEPLGFHTHPRHVFRWVLKGGYVEHYQNMRRAEMYDKLAEMPHWFWNIRAVKFLHPSWWIKPSVGHVIRHMDAGTRSLFVMVGKWQGWRIHQDESPGSSRVLQQGVAGKE